MTSLFLYKLGTHMVCFHGLFAATALPKQTNKLFVHHHPAASAGDGEDAVGVNER